MFECPKCKCEYEPIGCHEEDSGEHCCDQCCFKFIVEIEYDPTYSTTCVECEFGEPQVHDTATGKHKFQFCKHCERCVMIED